MKGYRTLVRTKAILFTHILIFLILWPVCSFAEKYGGGTGEPNNPYLIFTAEQMDSVPQYASDWDKHFKLMADVDMSLCNNPNRGIIGEPLFLVPTRVEIDSEQGKFYFSDWAQYIICRANLDGTDRECVISGSASQGFKLDTVNNKIYWTDLDADKIQRANLDGSGIEDLVITGLTVPGGIALDNSAGKMYWVDRGTNKLQRANLDGRNIETLLSDLLGPIDLTLVQSSGKVYWTETLAGAIGRANLDGSQVQYILTGLSYPWGIVADTNSGQIYWSGHSGIHRANLDGSDSVLLIPTGTGSMVDIAIDINACKMYWPENNIDGLYDTFSRADLDGSSVEVILRNYFIGVFDGNGYTIQNFELNSTGIDHVGIFGILDSPDAVVKNLGVVNPTVDAGDGERVGGLVGQMFAGQVENCYVKGGSISGKRLIGGLSGAAGASCNIINCYSQTTVIGDSYVGGIMGLDFGVNLSHCYAASLVQGSTLTGGLIGGFSSIAFPDCFWDTEVSEQGTSDGGVGKTTVQMQTKSTFTDAFWDFVDIWDLTCEGMNYPRLIWQIPIADFLCPDGVDFIDYSFFAAQWLNVCCAEQEGLVAHFKLDSDADDSSGNSYNGTLYGDPQFKPLDGIVNGALEFIGSDYVDITGFNGITGANARTVSAWIKTDTTGEIISWGTASAGQKWIFRVQDTQGTAGAIRAEVGAGYIVGSTDVRDNQWHHVAAVLEDGGSPNVNEVKLYVDGVLEDTSAVSGRAINTGGGTSMKIGVFIGTDRYFQGLIDEVKIYDQALTVEQIVPGADFTGDCIVSLPDFAVFCNYWLMGK